jgi:hypothetical protein
MNYKIKELEEYVEYRWDAIKQIDNVMQYEEEYEGKVSEQTKQFRDLAIARWATADKILKFLQGAEKHLIEEKK